MKKGGQYYQINQSKGHSKSLQLANYVNRCFEDKFIDHLKDNSSIVSNMRFKHKEEYLKRFISGHTLDAMQYWIGGYIKEMEMKQQSKSTKINQAYQLGCICGGVKSYLYELNKSGFVHSCLIRGGMVAEESTFVIRITPKLAIDDKFLMKKCNSNNFIYMGGKRVHQFYFMNFYQRKVVSIPVQIK